MTSRIPSIFSFFLSTAFVKQHNHKLLSICNFTVAVGHSLCVHEHAKLQLQ